MKDSMLIRKIRMDCPICGKIHEIEERERITRIEIRGVDASYRERYYLCLNTDSDENEFVTGRMNDENLANARVACEKLTTAKKIGYLRKMVVS